MIRENIPERFLRQLWKNRRFSTTNLHTSDNIPVEIISPGIQNHDTGPDFLNAVIRIGTVLHRGDVEIHQENEDWFLHQHHADPRYNTVILHVIFHADPLFHPPTTQRKRTIPVLVLSEYLIPPFRKTWHKMILDERAERQIRIPCSSINDEIDSIELRKWIIRISMERLELKVRRFEERLREMITEQSCHAKEPPPQYGEVPFGVNPDELPPPNPDIPTTEFRRLRYWEQLLYEGFMEALGYNKNQEPFLKLTRLASLQFLTQFALHDSKEEQVNRISAILFAIAGLLPMRGESLDDESRAISRQMKNSWREIRQEYHSEIMHHSEWQFFRLRPENFPTLRIAGAYRTIMRLLRHELFRQIVRIAKDRNQDAKKRLAEMEQLFIAESEGFWTNHFRFGEISRKPIRRLIGPQRAREIVLNVVIPISMLYARVFKEREVRDGILQLYNVCPAGSNNSIIAILDKNLLKGKMVVRSAMEQQGMLQLYKFYCLKQRCAECRIGKSIQKTLER